MPTKKTSKKTIVIKDSIGTVIGNYAKVVINQVNEKIIKRLGIEQRIFFSILFVAIILVGIFLYFALRPKVATTMSGDFRIAVAGFAVNGQGAPDDLGYELASDVDLRLEQDIHEINPDLVVTVWGPDQVGSIQGNDATSRAEQAEKIADRIQADMVVYGVVDLNGSNWDVTPEFYISTQNFYEAREITGQSDLGQALSFPSFTNPAWRYEFGKQMYARTQALSIISVGLGYYALKNYSTALQEFQSAENIQGWSDDQGKKVLYVLIGNAAGKLNNFDLLNTSVQEALSIDPDYARPYIGLAYVMYFRAIAPFQKSQKPTDVDNTYLTQCINYSNEALAAKDKPPLADVIEKADFARGQCYFMRAYSGHINSFDPAVKDFQTVISAYGKGANPRIRELAGESHARLGLIDNLIGNMTTAIQEYQTAADLLPDVPDQQQLYKKRAQELLGNQVTPTP